MLIPLLAIGLGCAGLLACALALLRFRPSSARDTAAVTPSKLNKDLDLARYKATGNPIIHLEKDLPDHPFKVGDGGVFCGVCLINTNLKRQTVPVLVHTHDCTVIRKEWKIAICRIGSEVEYFVSLGNAHLSKQR
jgi:hypothetical protein